MLKEMITKGVKWLHALKYYAIQNCTLFKWSAVIFVDAVVLPYARKGGSLCLVTMQNARRNSESRLHDTF